MSKFFAFIDESGVLDAPNSSQPFFAVGFLRLKDTGKLTEELMTKHYDYFSSMRNERKSLVADLRENPREIEVNELNLLLASTRHREYKYTNITFTTLERYKQFIDIAFDHSFHFCALVIDKTDPLFNAKIYKNYWYAYITYAKLLCENNCQSNEELCVIADYMNKPNSSDAVFEDELRKSSKVFNAVRAHSETFSLLQLCDLLLGSVVFQWKQSKGHTDSSSNRAKAKQEFVEHIISKLTIPSKKRATHPLAQAVTCHEPVYFSVWPLKLSK